MSNVIVTDSSASLPPEEVHRLGIRVVPLNLVIGGVGFTDGELSPEEVVRRAKAEVVTTSSPSPAAFAKAIGPGSRGDGAVIVTVASTMSSTYESAVLASRHYYEDAVRVVDSGTAAGAQGLVVLAAAERAAAGAGMDEVVAAAQCAASKVRLVAAIERLDFLARSGRVPMAAAWAGHSLGVRALFEFANGRARPLRPTFGMKAALDRIVGVIEEPPARPSVLRVATLHSQTAGQAHRLESQVRTAHPGADTFVAPFSSVMVAHTGPGLLGVAWWWEDAGGLTSVGAVAS